MKTLSTANADESAEPVQVDETVYAYLAGIIDGEGYVGISIRHPSAANKMTAITYKARLSIQMVDLEALDLFCEAFHSITPRYAGAPIKHQHRQVHVVDLVGQSIGPVLRHLLPYLRVKKRQALLVLAFLELQEKPSRHRTKPLHTIQSQGKHVGKAWTRWGLCDEYVAQCEMMYLECKTYTQRMKAQDFEGRAPLDQTPLNFSAEEDPK